MVINETETMESTAILSEDRKYRYLLTRTWDKDKPKATVLMLNPSKANVLKLDKTIMNILNFLIDNDYGSLTVVNLFSYISTDPKFLKERESEKEAVNDEYLIKAFRDTEIIIVAWTRDKYITRKNEVKGLLQDYQNKIRCFQDASGRKPRHPRDLGGDWTLVECSLSEDL